MAPLRFNHSCRDFNVSNDFADGTLNNLASEGGVLQRSWMLRKEGGDFPPLAARSTAAQRGGVCGDGGLAPQMGGEHTSRPWSEHPQVRVLRMDAGTLIYFV